MSTAVQVEDLEYETLEAEVNLFMDAYSASTSGIRFMLRQPLLTAGAFANARRLPVLRVAPSSSVEGAALRHELSRGSGILRSPLHTVSGVIRVPSDAAQFVNGPDKQTLRRKIRAAEKKGITWELVTDPVLRSRLVEIADGHERANPREQYRADVPRNQDLLQYDLWMLARSADGAPLLLSVIPVDNGVGALRYFRTLSSNDAASDARYLMTNAVVGELARREVHHLVDTTISMHLSHGLRHFQRMVGFRLIRVEVEA